VRSRTCPPDHRRFHGQGLLGQCLLVISGPEGLAAYNKLAREAVRAAGGQVLSRDGRVAAYESGITQRVVLIEFDSFEQAAAAYESEAYQQALMVLGDSVERDFCIVAGID
jgi:uncharacterized protein (DUF1330 family)